MKFWAMAESSPPARTERGFVRQPPSKAGALELTADARARV
jgi:hypothetical protein